MDEQDQEHAVNMLLTELRLLNARVAVLTLVASLSAALTVGGTVYAILVVIADATRGSAWPVGVASGLMVLVVVGVAIPTRLGISKRMERGLD